MTRTSTHISLTPTAGRSFGVVGSRYRLLATGEDTGGACALIEAVVPAGDGPPLHHHLNEDESFYVIDGVITITVDGRETAAGPGSFTLVPRGTVHTFRNDGPGTAKMLVMFQPAGLEKFFQKVGIPIADPTGDPPPATVEHMQKIVATAPDYGLIFEA